MAEKLRGVGRIREQGLSQCAARAETHGSCVRKSKSNQTIVTELISDWILCENNWFYPRGRSYYTFFGTKQKIQRDQLKLDGKYSGYSVVHVSWRSSGFKVPRQSSLTLEVLAPDLRKAEIDVAHLETKESKTLATNSPKPWDNTRCFTKIGPPSN